MIAEALRRWREDGQAREQVVSWVRAHPGFEQVGDEVLHTWWMTHRRMAGRGRRWPI
jgi:hypothetical protein